jgi:hypothetical protein
MSAPLFSTIYTTPQALQDYDVAERLMVFEYQMRPYDTRGVIDSKITSLSQAWRRAASIISQQGIENRE